MSVKLGLLTLMVLAVTLPFSNCQVTKPASDSTPPTVRWIVTHKFSGGQLLRENFGGNAIPTVNVVAGETLSVILVGEDPEGIRELTLGSGLGSEIGSSGNLHLAGAVACAVPGHDPGLHHNLDLPTEKETSSPASNGTVSAALIIVRDINPKELFKCVEPTSTVVGAKFALAGMGGNYTPLQSPVARLNICFLDCTWFN